MIIWLVTHGEKEDGPDPKMTIEGFKRVQSLRDQLNQRLPATGPAQVHIGTGRRQFDVARALDLKKGTPFFSALWGEGVTEIKIKGKSMILLTDGRIIEFDQYLSPKHMRGAIREAIVNLPTQTVICSGRPVLVRLGMALKECQSAALYAIHFELGRPDSIKIELVSAGIDLGDGKGATV
ncbi:MAG: hypothetical protein A2729_05600 [Candidatus Buchananbacteria bacterium RIFCSPHIGHO2_01_FULL_39_14]|uniref:Histidine phosphatase family protein n=2 Tax=Candidatus Buchananiibacteriota TaxID=1817903 RepID=A0A1G1YRZ1_9BACT|nr:MAG: hypothetical protein A2729_05600 [Candidatus Buchananbacteria bacterium RIFCSPHIGHO2_01_FULL_39_14]OGY49309.1 MAG: hypothetical protein A3D39_03975 [Candidatus Buchananbacteria bacterium RIFCSPHIGHO2_02_FULL_39_17]OGY55118.1 MAG: hypothetical protein A2912_00475 [Candidatus Buchananbacteria bacterium RIFCSPLOWO2_01_FULL_40_23b]